MKKILCVSALVHAVLLTVPCQPMSGAHKLTRDRGRVRSWMTETVIPTCAYVSFVPHGFSYRHVMTSDRTLGGQKLGVPITLHLLTYGHTVRWVIG